LSAKVFPNLATVAATTKAGEKIIEPVDSLTEIAFASWPATIIYALWVK